MCAAPGPAAPPPARPLPSLAALRAFEAAARTLSFSAAAREMNVSHAAVAQNVRRLEGELGRPLVRRAGRGLALTADGAALARGLTEGFDAIRAALDAFAEDDAARPVQVTMTPSFAATFLMPRLGAFRRRHPEVELMLNPTAQIVDLSAGGAELAIRYGDGDWPGLESRPLVSSPLAILAAPSLLEAHPVSGPEDLPDLPWLQEYGTDEIAHWLRALGVERRPRNVAHMPGFMLPGALLEGQGVCGLARALVEDRIAEGRITVLFEDADPEGRRGYHLVNRPGPMRPPLKAFATWLRREATAAAQG
jgi:LysR family glycine cleavage system transcriptional activator